MDLSIKNSSTVMCVTSGGPATSFYGECINEPYYRDSTCTYSKQMVTVDPYNIMAYINTLSLDTRNSTYYVCITRSETVTTLATVLAEFSRGISKSFTF